MDEVPEALVMEKIPDSPLRNMPAGRYFGTTFVKSRIEK